MLTRSYRFRLDDIVRIKLVADRLVVASLGAASGLRGSVALVTYPCGGRSGAWRGDPRGSLFTMAFI